MGGSSDLRWEAPFHHVHPKSSWSGDIASSFGFTLAYFETGVKFRRACKAQANVFIIRDKGFTYYVVLTFLLIQI